jgi:hypothetical protein
VTSGPWQLKAVPFGAANLTFAWDKSQGQNGDKLHLTVTRTKDDPTIVGVDCFTVVSTLGTADHAWIGTIGD